MTGLLQNNLYCAILWHVVRATKQPKGYVYAEGMYRKITDCVLILATVLPCYILLGTGKTPIYIYLLTFKDNVIMCLLGR